MRQHCFTTSRLVKSEDLNHHGTLFAGRMAEWFIEASFISAAGFHGKPHQIVCLEVHGMKFTKSIDKGDIITITSRVAHLGKTSIVVHADVHKLSGNNQDHGQFLEGFVTFVCIESDGKKLLHNLVLPSPVDEAEAALREAAAKLRKV